MNFTQSTIWEGCAHTVKPTIVLKDILELECKFVLLSLYWYNESHHIILEFKLQCGHAFETNGHERWLCDHSQNIHVKMRIVYFNIELIF